MKRDTANKKWGIQNMSETMVSEYKGIYVAKEAASYLKATLPYDINLARNQHADIKQPVKSISSRNLINWIRAGLMSPDLINIRGNELLISFEDLVSMRIISILKALGVSWVKIHRAEEWLREKTGYPRPFAIERVWTETEDVFSEFHDTFIVASRHGQLAFTTLLEQYLKPIEDMSFKQYHDVYVADTWKPHRDILIDPRIQFGEPCIKGTRVRTRVLSDLVKGGDSPSYLMQTFDLSINQINHALEWEQKLQHANSTRQN